MDAMRALQDYVEASTIRGPCECGHCIDRPEGAVQPEGHTVDLYFFQVAKRGEPTADTLRELVTAAAVPGAGVHMDANPLDGGEHNYMELGAWIGSQGLAMQLMGLGELLGLWTVMQPKMLPGVPKDLMDRMAGGGMVAILPAPIGASS